MGFKFDLGQHVKDQITGLTGIVIGRTEWLNGCRRYGVERTKPKTDGTYADPDWYDEGRLTLMSRGHKTDLAYDADSPEPQKRRGGPTSVPTITPAQG